MLEYLSEEGFTFVPLDDKRYVVVSNQGDRLPLQPVLTIPADQLREYLQAMANGLDGAADPLAQALALAEVHVFEELATAHVDGRNYVSALGFRRVRGRVEFYVEHDLPEPGSPLPPSSDLQWMKDPPG